MLGLRLLIFFCGRFVGKDVFGNRYYRQRRKGHSWHNERRWVLYKGMAEASKVPPTWYGWLHHTMETPPQGERAPFFWEKLHVPNLTGTRYAYHPSHFLQEKKAQFQGYESWSPEGLGSKKV
ncbi:MAG: NADH-ubiquinone oxidoreductase subunit NDUFA12 family protein [Alphaproteobacteria bacterium]